MANGHSVINYEVWDICSGNCIYYTENFNEIAELMKDNPEYAKDWIISMQYPDHTELGIHFYDKEICLEFKLP